MSANEKIFHESWYQIANQKIALRSSVFLQRQFFRGQLWYVAHDPFSNQYYRIGRNAYNFVARLGMNRTVEEIWNELLETMPEKAPTQTEIIDLLAQLYQANFLHYDAPPNSVKLFDRYKKRRTRLVQMNVLNIMFARIPLFDPNALLVFLLPLIRLLISPLGLILWLGAVGWGIKTVIDNGAAVMTQSEGILAPSNIFLLYIGMVIVKVIHEFGHAFAVRRFGGEVHALGIMLMVMTPFPYTDATAAWSFKHPWQRIFVSAAGMVFELFVAAIAALVWAGTGEGTLHALAYNMMFTASVSTLVFNINPLLRYDGYYILSDLMSIPNLQQQAAKQWAYALERYCFGKKEGISPAASRREAWFLLLYAGCSFVYRIIVFGGILLFISTKFLLLAVIMAVFFAGSWAIYPIVKFIRYLVSSPSLARVRGRALRVCAAAGAAAFCLLAYAPFPYSFRAPGVLKAVEYVISVNSVAGRVTACGKPSGSRAVRGDTLMLLDNTELTDKRSETEAALRQARLEYDKALEKNQADCEPIANRIIAYSKNLEHLNAQIAQLAVTAPINGDWVAPDADDYIGRWLPRGTAVGQLIDPRSFYFLSVVSQRQISELFSRKPRSVLVKLSGQADRTVAVTSFTAIPMEQRRLPSSALGFLGGGDISISMGDTSGVQTTEPFYEVRALLDTAPSAAMVHGRSGKIRFFLGYKPLLWQGWRALRQLMQKQYMF